MHMTIGDIICYLFISFLAACYLHSLVFGQEEHPHKIRYVIWLALLAGLMSGPFWNGPL